MIADRGRKVEHFFSCFCYTMLFCFSKKRQSKFHTLLNHESSQQTRAWTHRIHSSDIDFRDFMNLYKKYISKPYSLLVIDATFA